MLSSTSFARLQSSPRSLLASQSGRVLLLVIFAFCLWWQYGRAYFYRDPLSVFFDPDRAYERRYSALREVQANEFIEQVAAGVAKGERYQKAGRAPSLCATFLTIKRRLDKQYIDASIGSFLTNLTTEERRDLHLRVSFATHDPTPHPTWSAPWLRPLCDEVTTYQNTVSDAEFRYLKMLEDEGRYLEKGIRDYALALERCYHMTESPYIAVFEGDILLAEGWFARTLQGLEAVAAGMAELGKPSKWLFLRLFNQERSIGWSSPYKLTLRTSLIVGSILGTILLLLRRRVSFIRSHLEFATVLVVCCIAVPAALFVLFLSGKASLFPPAEGVRNEAFGCCSQGLVYNRAHVPGLVRYLRARKTGKYDMIIRDYWWISRLERWALYPVQIQHIGTRSSLESLNTSAAETQAVWSMAFESLDPDWLRREHARMANELYGPAN